MDVALVRFVGAGITSVAAGLGVQVPRGAIEGGYNLVSYLLANNPDRTRGLIEGAVRELWADWKRSGLPPKVAATHLEVLPMLMDQHRPADDRFVGALAVAKTAIRSGPAAVMVPSRRIATSIVTAARQSETMPGEVSDAIALFFLERLYCHLLMERNALLELGPTLDAYFYKSLWRGKTYDPAVASAASGRSTPAAPAMAVEVEPEAETGSGSTAPEAAVAEMPPPTAPAATERSPGGMAQHRPQVFPHTGLADPAKAGSPTKAELSPSHAELPQEAPAPTPPTPAPTPPTPAPAGTPSRHGQPVFREPVAPPNAIQRLPRLRALAQATPVPAPEHTPPVDTPANAAVSPTEPQAAAETAIMSLPSVSTAADIATPIAAALVAAEAPMARGAEAREEPVIAAAEPMNVIAVPAADAMVAPVAEQPETGQGIAADKPDPILSVAAEDEALSTTPGPIDIVAPAAGIAAASAVVPAATVAAAEEDVAAAAEEPVAVSAPAPVDELENDPLVLEIADRTGAPARVVAALADDLVANGDGTPLDETLLVAACTSAASLLETMRTISGRALPAQVHRTEAILALDDGNLDGADRALALAEDEELKAAQRDINASRGHLAQASGARSLRAALAKIRGDLRGAARHYAVAARCLSPLDRAGRWDMLWAQTRVLVELANSRDGAPVLLEAVDTLRQAVAVISPREAALEWAQAHKQIAELLLEAQTADGQRSHAVEAIEHVDQAIDVLSRARATDAWADAQILKGMALQRLALSDEGRHTLDQAIEVFRSALGPLSASRTPVAQAKALARLGLALKDLGERAEDSGAYVEAITQLRAAADLDEGALRKAGYEVSELSLATAGAIAALSGVRRDPEMLAGAVTELRRAVQLMSEAEARPLADAEERLASALERLGRHRRDPALLQEAARVKLAAHDRHEKLGNRQIADRLRDELEALHDDMAGLAAEAPGKPNVYARAS